MAKSLQDDIMSTAKSFTEQFAEKGPFDYSLESLQAVEELLSELIPSVKDDSELVANIAFTFGCYIFEVARRNFGGVYYWIEDKRQPVLVTGEPNYSVSFMSFEKVRGRILNGIEDNIPYFVQGFAQAIEKGKETGGYKATIM